MLYCYCRYVVLSASLAYVPLDSLELMDAVVRSMKTENRRSSVSSASFLLPVMHIECTVPELKGDEERCCRRKFPKLVFEQECGKLQKSATAIEPTTQNTITSCNFS